MSQTLLLTAANRTQNHDPFMDTPEQQPEQPRRKKHSFDAEGKAYDILEYVESKTALKKGRFICRCIEIAQKQAFDELAAELKAWRNASQSASEKQGKR